MPLHICAYWSVLDHLIVPERGCVNGYVKETDYIEQHNKNSIVDSATNKVKCSPMLWEKYFGLYAKEKNCVSHSNIFFGSDDMTLGKNKKISAW